MNKYLIVSPAWVGDMVMSQSLYRLLKQRDPECLIDVLAPASALPMAEFMPEINQSILFDVKHGEFGLLKRRRLAHSLKSNRYSQSIVLPNSWKSALVPYFAGIKKRTGFKGESRYILLNDIRSLNKTRLPLMIDRFCQLALPKGQALPETLPYPHFKANINAKQLLKERLHLTLDQPVVGFCPGAEYGPAKKWPTHYFAALADQLLAHGYTVWLFGGPNDQTTTQEIINYSKDKNKDHRLIDYAGKTSLVDAVNLMDFCDYVVTNDTGLMHIANALDKITLVIYGSTSDRFTPPLNTRADSVFIEGLPCRPCFKRTCPLVHMNCLNQLTVDIVSRRFFELVARYV